MNKRERKCKKRMKHIPFDRNIFLPYYENDRE